MKALVCGSFDPITKGHIDLIKRAAEMFESVTVGMFINAGKKYYFDEETRYSMLCDAVKDIKNVSCDISHGLVASYVKEKGIDVIVKGVRNSVDYEYEIQMARVNRSLAPETETVFLPAYGEMAVISSSTVKTLYAGGEDISEFVTDTVLQEFKKHK